MSIKGRGVRMVSTRRVRRVPRRKPGARPIRSSWRFDWQTGSIVRLSSLVVTLLLSTVVMTVTYAQFSQSRARQQAAIAQQEAARAQSSAGASGPVPSVAPKEVVRVEYRDFPSWATWSIVVTVGILVGSVVMFLFVSLRLKREAAQEERRRIQGEQEAYNQAIDRLRERMALPSLIELNRIMLDTYHQIATGQATRSYRSSQRAMWCGFIWLVACFTAGLALQSISGVAFAGLLASVGGLLSAFLSRTYLRVYERALDQLNQYFNQPLLNSYYLTAERLVEQVPQGSRASMVGKMIDQLMSTTSLMYGTPAPISARVETSRVRRSGRSRRAGRGSNNDQAGRSGAGAVLRRDRKGNSPQ